MPKVSVIIPMYNCQKFIAETIESVLSQTYKDFEIIAVDDGSTDKTQEIVQNYSDRVRYIYQKNQGVSVARNNAIGESQGKYIALLDHDDLWLPNKLEKQMPLFDKNPHMALVFSDAYYFDDRHPVLFNYFSKNRPHRGKVFGELFRKNFIACLTAVIKKEVFDRVGYFSVDMNIAEEYDLFLRIAYQYEVDYINVPLAKYRVHETSFSRNVELAIKEEFMVIQNCIDTIPDFEQLYMNELSAKRAQLAYVSGKNFWRLGKSKKARQEFLKSMKESFFFKSLLLYGLSFFNYHLFLALNSLRDKFLRWRYNLIPPKKL